MLVPSPRPFVTLW